MPTGVTYCINNARQKAKIALEKQANRAIWESPLVAQNQHMPNKINQKCCSQNQTNGITEENTRVNLATGYNIFLG